MRTKRPASGRALVTDRRVVDAALVLGCLFLTVLAVKTPWVPLPRPAVAVAGVLGSVAQLFRRRWPYLAAVAGTAAYPLSGNPGSAFVGLYAAGAYGPRGGVVPLAVVGWAGFAGWSWVDAGTVTVNDAVAALLAAAMAVGVGRYAATRRALVESLRDRAAHAEAERRLREEGARTAERTRIAREMHDVLAHKVSLIALHAGALELHAADDSRLRHSAALVRSTAREALRELRGVLRADQETDPVPERFGDVAALVRASADAGQPVVLHDRASPLPQATARVVYRTVQEGLTNVHKHAPGAATTVSLDRAGDSVTVTVHNEPGAAAEDLPGAGAGLAGLAERVRLVGGTLHSGPHGAGGWELRATVPWLPRPVEDDAR